ncbi:MAG: hypothetical protein RIR66_848 [Actinomycetota bacterium]
MKLAVLGSPISHSLSPTLHKAAYAQLGLPHTFEAIDVNVDQFKTFFTGLDDQWLGLSLTMPLKEIAFEVATKVSNVARQTGAINTLVLKDGVQADNTDVYGISKSLRNAGCTNPKTATIIGAGATTRSAIAALSGLGVEGILIIARNAQKSATCIDLGNELGISIDATANIEDKFFTSDVTINATPVGVADDFVTKLSSARGVLLDVVYNPWPTKLAAAWKAKGLKAIPGNQMLLNQAVRQIELFTGQIPDIQNMQEAMFIEMKARGQQID